MLRFLPVDSYEETKRIYEERAIPFAASAFAILAYDAGRTAGGCLFLLRGEIAEISHVWIVDTGEAFLLDGLFRATLNFALNREIGTARLSEKAAQTLLPAVPAVENLQIGGFEIETFFSQNKNCGNS